jgi:conjugal transfer pilus assembly protein TraB
MSSLIDRYNDLPSQTQVRIRRLGTIVGVLVLAMFVYYGTGRDKVVAPPPPAEKDIGLGDALLADDVLAKAESRMVEVEVRMEEIAKAQADVDRQLDTITSSLEKLNQALMTSPLSEPGSEIPPGITFPERPNSDMNSQQTYDSGSINSVQIQEPVYVGSVKRVEAVKKSDSKKKALTLYPGFMEGTLLTGIEADALGGASGEPEPIMIRIDTPAILPNRVKAHLQGCFITASATGKINKERVEGRTIGLFCIKKDGQGAVQAEIKGFIADQDGNKGMAGIVVSKAGPLILRAATAGVIMGVGEAFEAGSGTTSVTGTGVVTTRDEDQVARAAAGGGISKGAEQFNDLMIEYIKQTTPVITVGTNKKVTVCITEPAELNIIEDAPYAEL